MLFADSNLNGIITLIAILGTAALIAIVAFVIHRVMHPKLKDDGKPTDEQITQEELDRVLVPIEDEDTAREVSEYKEEE